MAAQQGYDVAHDGWLVARKTIAKIGATSLTFGL
jgi:hypothetical protein